MSQAEIITKQKNDCLYNVQWRDGTLLAWYSRIPLLTKLFVKVRPKIEGKVSVIQLNSLGL